MKEGASGWEEFFYAFRHIKTTFSEFRLYSVV